MDTPKRAWNARTLTLTLTRAPGRCRMHSIFVDTSESAR
jgi:hypothetical protein